MNTLKKLALPIAVVAITAGATNGLMGGTLTAIPTLSGDTNNEGRTIAPDGLWVGGLSGTRGFLYDVNSANVFNVLSADGAQSSGVVGLGYRYEGSQQEIIMGGLSSGWNTDYMTTNGTAFPNKRRDTSVGSNPRVPVTNARAGTSSDVYYETWWDANPSGYQIYVGQFSGTWPAAVTPAWDIKGIPNGIVCEMHGISSTGRAVGWRGSPKANYVLDWKGIGTPGQWNFYGLDGTTVGEAFAVSADGTAVFGQSPVSDGRPGNWGYKTVLAATMPGPAVQLSTNELPNFVDTDGSGGSAAVPYGCTADGNLAVGMSYRGLEKAVLWDTADPNPANWTVTDLTDLATAEGILGNFTRLYRGV